MYATLFTHNAADVFIQTRLVRFGYQWLTVFGGKDDVIKEIDVRLRHRFGLTR
ncbi:MAG: hypothetical protein WKF84_14660 [Pyrinomonadaceae bacterium]